MLRKSITGSQRKEALRENYPMQTRLIVTKLRKLRLRWKEMKMKLMMMIPMMVI